MVRLSEADAALRVRAEIGAVVVDAPTVKGAESSLEGRGYRAAKGVNADVRCAAVARGAASTCWCRVDHVVS